MSIVIQQAPTALALGSSFIAYDNFMLRSDAVVSADSADADHAVENGISWPTYGGGWQTGIVGTHNVTVGFPATRTGQSFALHKHNLGTLSITVKLQTSTDGLAWTDVAGSEQTPAGGDDSTIFFTAATITTAPFWRILFSGHVAGDPAMRVAQIFIGPAFQLFNSPGIGWSPPNLALNNEYVMSRADGGDFLGRSLIRRGARGRFTMMPVTETFTRDIWLPFMLEAELHPFYFCWDTANFPKECAYCYVDRQIPIPRYSSSRHFTVPLNFVALQL